MDKAKVSGIIKKYTMVIVLVLVTLFFTWQTGGKMLLPQNVTNLIAQNAYVFILAAGMLLCILTGGNIDLSVGSVVCFVGAVGGTLMVNKKYEYGTGHPDYGFSWYLNWSMAGFLDCVRPYPSVYRNTCRYAGFSRTV